MNGRRSPAPSSEVVDISSDDGGSDVQSVVHSTSEVTTKRSGSAGRKKSEFRGFRFVATIFDYSDDEYRRLCEWSSSYCKYAIIGRERCPTTDRPHLQCFFNLRAKVRTGKLASDIGFHGDTRATITGAKGSDEQNRVYCSKSGDFFSTGVPQVPGRSSALGAAIPILLESGMEAVAESHPEVFIRNHRGMGALLSARKYRRRDRAVPPIVLWFHGKSGSGKTRSAYDIAETFNISIYKKDCNTSWWGGYTQQKVCVFDDIRTTSFNGHAFKELLRLLDRYPTTVQPKGEEMEFNSPVLVCTSILHPSLMWQALEQDEPLEQLERRVTQCFEFTDSNYDDLKIEIEDFMEQFIPRPDQQEVLLPIDLDSMLDE